VKQQQNGSAMAEASLVPPKYYFVPDDEEVFRIAILEPLNDSKLLKIIPVDAATCKALPQTFKGTAATIHEGDAIAIDTIEELQSLPSDLIKLKNVNRATILLTLKERFQRDEIYTSIGSILIAVNPFKWIPGLYDDHMVDRYRVTKDSVDMQSQFPHTYAVTRAAFDELASDGGNQSLIISGESGAGKTEATKQCLNYLARAAGTNESDMHEHILKVGPILEAWGNAKTLRNNNSSRLGLFTHVPTHPTRTRTRTYILHTYTLITNLVFYAHAFSLTCILTHIRPHTQWLRAYIYSYVSCRLGFLTHTYSNISTHTFQTTHIHSSRTSFSHILTYLYISNTRPFSHTNSYTYNVSSRNIHFTRVHI
jgi:hypothetical protein